MILNFVAAMGFAWENKRTHGTSPPMRAATGGMYTKPGARPARARSIEWGGGGSRKKKSKSPMVKAVGEWEGRRI